MRSSILLFLLLFAGSARAAVSISAALNRTSVAIGEQVVLSVTVSGDQASLPQPKLPPMDAFNVYDSGRSQSLSFVNGHMSSEVVHTFVLAPRVAGKHVVPPISADGASAPTAALNVEVLASAPPPNVAASRPSAAPAGSTPRVSSGRARGNDVFVTASLDKATAKVNEQVTLTVRFYNAVQLFGDTRFDPPALNGFLSEDLPPVRNGMTNIEGRPYQYNEIKVALFPVQAGRMSIGSAVIHCQVARLGARGDDFFDRFFSMAAPQPVTVQSDPLVLTVEPVPTGKPADFTGVVGQLTASAQADRASVKAGDAVTLSVTIAGHGNIKSIPDPVKPDLPSLRFFATDSSVVLDKTNDRVGGSKILRTVLVPRVSGDIRIPSFSFSYYDPQRNSYQRATTEEIVLHVSPGAPGVAMGTTPSSPLIPGLTAIADDIRYLKSSGSRNPLSAFLTRLADLGPWHALPFLILLAAGGTDWRRRAAGADPKGRRFRAALSQADRRLEQAALAQTDAPRAAALVDEAIAAFVADKLDVPTAGLTLKTALEGLGALAHPPSEASLGLLKSAWDEAHLRRFAPGAAGTDARHFAEETRKLLKLLDSEIRR